MTTHKLIPICAPFIPQESIDAVTATLKSGWISGGETVENFENAFARKYFYKHAVAVNSCTSALKLALALAGIKTGDYVITTPNTFIATNTAILEQGATPIFADIEYDTGNISVDSIDSCLGKFIINQKGLKKINNSAKIAIMMVHYMGYPCDIEGIAELSKKYYYVPVIEDAAQAIGASQGINYVGSGEFGCFSFQAVKQLTTGDGGMFTTDDEQIYEDTVKLSWYGYSKESRNRSAHTGIEDDRDDIEKLGFKMRMNAINASMGLAQLPYIDNNLLARRMKAKIYKEELEKANRVTLFNYKDISKQGSYFMYPIHVENRERFMIKMKALNIEAYVHNFRNDRYSIFGQSKFLPENLPAMMAFERDYVCLPIHHEVTIEDIMYICRHIRDGW